MIISVIPFNNCQALESFTILNSFVNKNITNPISINKTRSFKGFVYKAWIYDVIIVDILLVAPI